MARRADADIVGAGRRAKADSDDASKIAFVTLCRVLAAWGFDFVDCQVTTDHLLSLGAFEISRDEFLDRLEKSLERPTRVGKWTDAFAGGR